MNATMDFRPQRTRRRSRNSMTRSPLPFLLAPLILLALFVYHSRLASELDTLNAEVAMYQQQGMEYSEISREYDALLARQQRLNATLAAVQHLTADTVRYGTILDGLVPRITLPENNQAQGFLRSITITPTPDLALRDNADPDLPGQRHGVTLAGTTRSADALARIVTGLERDTAVETVFDSATRVGDAYEYHLRLTTVHETPASTAAAQDDGGDTQAEGREEAAADADQGQVATPRPNPQANATAPSAPPIPVAPRSEP